MAVADCAGNRALEVGEGKGLHQQRSGRAGVSRHPFRRSRDQDDTNARAAPQHLCRDNRPREVRKIHIGDQGIERAIVSADQVDRLLPGGGNNGLITFKFQAVSEQVPYRRLIVDQRNWKR